MKKIITILFALFVSLFSFHSLKSQIIYVPGDHSTIQDGINATGNGDTVLVSEDTYYENIRFMGKDITVASYFILDGDSNHISNTIINGSQAADPDSAATVMFVNNEDTNSIINGFTITGGSGITWQGQNRCGGGVVAFNAGAKILNNIITENHIISNESMACGAGVASIRHEGNHWCVIRNNTISHNTSTINPLSSSSAYGGGIYSSASAIISNNTIEYNFCENTGTTTDIYADGGGIEIEHLLGSNPATVAEITGNTICYNSLNGVKGYGAGVMVWYASVTIRNNMIRNNSIIASQFGDGGGIYIRNPLNEIQIVDNDISDNTITSDYYARGGGVMFNNPSAELIVTGNRINDNKLIDAVECRGSGILFRNSPVKISVLNNEFIGNTGNSDAEKHNGGGVCLNDAYDSIVIFDGNIFDSNSAILGGGLYARRSYNLQVKNNLFINNTSYNGGGIDFYHPATDNMSSYHPQIVNNTFYKNWSDHGGGICLNCETNVPLIFNNIFWENLSPQYNDILYNSGSGTESILVSYNNIDSNEISGDWYGEGNMNEDPLFIPEDDSLHIAEASPCRGNAAEFVNFAGIRYYCPDHDYEGDPRPGFECHDFDMGADEIFEVCVGIENNLLISSYKGLKLAIYPNPFSTYTTFSYTIDKPSCVTISIFNPQGQLLEKIVQEQPLGEQQVQWNPEGYTPGMYYYRIQAGDKIGGGKMVLMK